MTEAASKPEVPNEIFIIEKVLATRTKRMRIEYFIKWKGYVAEDNSWEPRSLLRNTAGILGLDRIVEYENGAEDEMIERNFELCQQIIERNRQKETEDLSKE